MTKARIHQNDIPMPVDNRMAAKLARCNEIARAQLYATQHAHRLAAAEQWTQDDCAILGRLSYRPGMSTKGYFSSLNA